MVGGPASRRIWPRS